MSAFLKKITRFPLVLDLQHFAGEDGGGGGDDDKGGGGGAKTYTEDELKAKIKEERKAAAEAAIKKRFGDLADIDIEEIRAAVELKRKQDEEKNKGKGKDESGSGVDPAEVKKLLDTELKAEREKTFKRLVAAEVKVLAAELGFADWEDAHALADLSEVKEDDKGNLTGVKEALEELAKKKPHLLKAKKSGSFGAEIPADNKAKTERLENLKKLAQSRGQVATQVANDPWKKP